MSSESLTFVKHKSSVFSLASDEHVLFSISNPFSNSYLHAVLPNFSMLTKQKRYAQYIVHVMENHHKLRLVQLSLFSCHLFLLQEHTLKLCNTWSSGWIQSRYVRPTSNCSGSGSRWGWCILVLCWFDGEECVCDITQRWYYGQPTGKWNNLKLTSNLSIEKNWHTNHF